MSNSCARVRVCVWLCMYFGTFFWSTYIFLHASFRGLVYEWYVYIYSHRLNACIQGAYARGSIFVMSSVYTWALSVRGCMHVQSLPCPENNNIECWSMVLDMYTCMHAHDFMHHQKRIIIIVTSLLHNIAETSLPNIYFMSVNTLNKAIHALCFCVFTGLYAREHTFLCLNTSRIFMQHKCACDRGNACICLVASRVLVSWKAGDLNACLNLLAIKREWCVSATGPCIVTRTFLNQGCHLFHEIIRLWCLFLHLANHR